jgi:cytochrome c2
MTNKSVIATLAAVALVITAASSFASEKIGRDTGKECVACHDKPGSKLLTDRGKYFEVMHTLDGYDQVKASFGQCTSCHVRKPGSKKLTRKGQQMASMARDMSALREWVQQNHPAPPR